MTKTIPYVIIRHLSIAQICDKDKKSKVSKGFGMSVSKLEAEVDI